MLFMYFNQLNIILRVYVKLNVRCLLGKALHNWHKFALKSDSKVTTHTHAHTHM